MQIFRALFELVTAIVSVVVGLIEVVIRRIERPILVLAIKIQSVATSLRRSAEKLRNETRNMYPQFDNDDGDPIVKIIAGVIVIALVIAACFVPIALLAGRQ